jgi:hypothetical protein
MDEKMMKLGGADRRRELITELESLTLCDGTSAVYDRAGEIIAKQGEEGQGEYMTKQKYDKQRK